MLRKIVLLGLALAALVWDKPASEFAETAYCQLYENTENKELCEENDDCNVSGSINIPWYTSDIENYVVGVVAGELPVTFPLEALKAQAIAARTYALRQQQTGGNIWQEYISVEEMKDRWGNNFDEYYKKVCDAVFSTRGEIIVYDNQPVLAVFCSSSGGKTEASENVWGGELPYLKSVSSEGDCSFPDFENEVRIGIYELSELLGADCNQLKNSFEIRKRTEADYVQEVSVDGKIFTGNEIRSILGLKSADFTVEFDGDNAVIKTKGFGHGVGMSQYGAAYMAQRGSSCYEILKHYYTGVQIKRIDS